MDFYKIDDCSTRIICKNKDQIAYYGDLVDFLITFFFCLSFPLNKEERQVIQDDFNIKPFNYYLKNSIEYQKYNFNKDL